jgi:threonylcarbamoyladenosine tRNA methylthiotransferase MtaB
MARVYGAFVGCKVSAADAEQAMASLAAAGHVRSAQVGEADVAVVVTCAVTAEAERKSRRLVHRLAAGGRPVVVTGCAAVYRPQQFVAPGVSVAARSDVLEAVRVAAGEAPPPGAAAAGARELGRGRTRLTLKVQDGCAGACTYCAVRLARGPLWSLPIEQAVRAAREGLAAGCGEVVVSGINVGLYQDGAGEAQGRVARSDDGLARLIEALCELPDLQRLRLSSVEPLHLQAPLLRALAHPKVARHLHVPLQSADDGVLAAMGRPYDFVEYRARLAAARRALGNDLVVTTDVIVGFPTEDERAFARTLAAIEPEAGLFGRVHVFPFSSRPGTAAAELAPLPAGVVRQRRAAALSAAAAARRAAARAELGGEAEVLVEDCVAGLWRGYTSRYTRCYIEGNAQAGRLVRVAVQALFRDGVRGVVA